MAIVRKLLLRSVSGVLAVRYARSPPIEGCIIHYPKSDNVNRSAVPITYHSQ